MTPFKKDKQRDIPQEEIQTIETKYILRYTSTINNIGNRRKVGKISSDEMVLG